MEELPSWGGKDIYLFCMKPCCIVLLESNKTGPSGSTVFFSGSVVLERVACMLVCVHAMCTGEQVSL